MKHKKTIIGIILIAIVVIFILLSGYRSIKNSEEKINNDYSNILIDIETKISIVNKITNISSENKTEVNEINKAIKELEDSHTINKKLESNNNLNNKINILLVKNADNNKISSNTTYKKLIKDLDEISTKILKDTTSYNNSIKKYNKTINKFPNNFISKIFKFKKQKAI